MKAEVISSNGDILSQNTTLTAKQQTALAELLLTGSQERAATRVGVTVRTVQRWQSDPAFTCVYLALRRQAVQAAFAYAQQSSQRAIATLNAIMEDGEAPASARVAAATRILELAAKALEVDDLLVRVEVLEQVTAEDRRSRRLP
jgi:hypothetical protein